MTNSHFPSLEPDSHLLTRQLVAQLPVDQMENLVQAYAPVSLPEISSVALLNRMDTKYLLSSNQLVTVLNNLRTSYRVLAIGERRIHHYWTLYYDTPGFELYHAHVTRRAHIYKVRCREYQDTRLSYLEIKHKDLKQRTNKRRLHIECPCISLEGECSQFLQDHLPSSVCNLEPRLWNTFRRITLVSRCDLERLTIDLDLRFFNPYRSLSLDGVAIAELKQEKWMQNSPFVTQMRSLSVRQTGFSKYCFGVAQLYPRVKSNTQKKKALLIEKIQRGGQAYVCSA